MSKKNRKDEKNLPKPVSFPKEYTTTVPTNKCKRYADTNNALRSSKESRRNRSNIKLEFPYGSIVSINGFDLDNTIFPEKMHAPTIYGSVQNPLHHDDRATEELKEGQSFVSFVLSGEVQ